MGNEVYRPRFAFIPKPLDIEDRPELSKFPLNILFGCAWDISAHALYVPDLATFTFLPQVSNLTYFNEHDLSARVVIEYFLMENRWWGSKYYGSETVGLAVGKDWPNFFIHLTMIGCDPRENTTTSEVG